MHSDSVRLRAGSRIAASYCNTNKPYSTVMSAVSIAGDGPVAAVMQEVHKLCISTAWHSVWLVVVHYVVLLCTAYLKASMQHAYCMHIRLFECALSGAKLANCMIQLQGMDWTCSQDAA